MIIYKRLLLSTLLFCGVFCFTCENLRSSGSASSAAAPEDFGVAALSPRGLSGASGGIELAGRDQAEPSPSQQSGMFVIGSPTYSDHDECFDVLVKDLVMHPKAKRVADSRFYTEQVRVLESQSVTVFNVLCLKEPTTFEPLFCNPVNVLLLDEVIDYFKELFNFSEQKQMLIEKIKQAQLIIQKTNKLQGEICEFFSKILLQLVEKNQNFSLVDVVNFVVSGEVPLRMPGYSAFNAMVVSIINEPRGVNGVGEVNFREPFGLLLRTYQQKSEEIGGIVDTEFYKLLKSDHNFLNPCFLWHISEAKREQLKQKRAKIVDMFKQKSKIADEILRQKLKEFRANLTKMNLGRIVDASDKEIGEVFFEIMF